MRPIELAKFASCLIAEFLPKGLLEELLLFWRVMSTTVLAPAGLHGLGGSGVLASMIQGAGEVSYRLCCA